jgi:hypothetical protein
VGKMVSEANAGSYGFALPPPYRGGGLTSIFPMYTIFTER